MASAIILLPFYIAYLPTAVYGALSVCLAFSIFVQILVTYSFDTSLYVHYHEFKNSPERLKPFVSSLFIFLITLGAGVTIFFSFIGESLFSVFFKNDELSFFPYGLVSVGIGACQAIFKVQCTFLQTREKPVTFFWANVLSFAIIAVTTIGGLKYFPGTLIGPLGGRLVAAMLASMWSLFRVFSEFGFHFTSPWKFTSFSFNAYTFVYQLQQWAINYLDRFLILYFLPLSTVGVYDFAVKCVAPIELLLNGLNASINPRVVSRLSQQQTKSSSPEINRYFYGLVAAMVLTICLVIVAIPPVLNFFVEKSEYFLAVQYIPFLALMYILKSERLYFVVPYVVLKKMKTLTSLNFFVAVLKVLVMVWFIVEWQLLGVIFSGFLAYAIEIVLLWYFLKTAYVMRFNFFKLFGMPLLILGVIMMTEWTMRSYPVEWIRLSYGGLCAILMFIAYRNELKLLKPFKTIR